MLRHLQLRPVFYEGANDGGAGAPDPGAGEGTGDGGDPPEPKNEKTFTQAQVDAIATREAAKAERNAAQKLADELGMTPAEAKKAIEAQTEQQRAAMTEADRKLAEAADRDKAATARETAAAQKEHDANVTIALLGVGLDPKKAARAGRMLDLEVGADDKTIGEAIEALKVEIPELFAAKVDTDDEDEDDGKQKGGTAPSGDTAGRKPPKGSASQMSSALTRGAERAKKDNAQRGIKDPVAANA